MGTKFKHLVRQHMVETGMSYQAAFHDLRRIEREAEADVSVMTIPDDDFLAAAAAFTDLVVLLTEKMNLDPAAVHAAATLNQLITKQAMIVFYEDHSEGKRLEAEALGKARFDKYNPGIMVDISDA